MKDVTGMKRALAFILVITMVFVLTGCNDEVSRSDTAFFEEIYRCRNYYVILQDKNTKVCYIWLNPNSGNSGITALLDAEGKPITEWSREDAENGLQK